MTEILYFATGLLSGGILAYIWLHRSMKDTAGKLIDSLVKNRLLKDEIGKSDKTKKTWTKKSKKRYYGNKKRNG